MKRYKLIAIAALMAGMPAPGQQIIQRMERDVVVETKPEQHLEKAPLLELPELKQIASFSRFAKELRSEENGLLRRAALRLSQRDYALAQKEWELALSKMKEREFEPDVEALVRGVLHEAYLEKDVRFKALADAIVFRDRQREVVYDERDRMERMKASFEGGKSSDGVLMRTLTVAESFGPGVRPIEWSGPQAATLESVSSELQKLVVLCTTADENAEQSVVDLQKALDGEVFQTMSSAAKMLHDTAKAIINNIKA